MRWRGNEQGVMAIYFLIALVFFGFGGIVGVATAFLFGMLVSRNQPPIPPQIEPEILAEMLTERLELQALQSKAKKVTHESESV